jgi:hypothetical protein
MVENLLVELDALFLGFFVLAIGELSLPLERTKALDWRQWRLTELGQEGFQTLQLKTGVEGGDARRYAKVNLDSFQIFATLTRTLWWTWRRTWWSLLQLLVSSRILGVI